MAALTLPAAGVVALDANCLIYSVERIDPYAQLLEPAWRAADAAKSAAPARG